MNKGISLGLVAVGGVLLVTGFRATTALDSEISKFFTGAPTDRTIWLVIAGLLAFTVGLFGLLRRGA